MNHSMLIRLADLRDLPGLRMFIENQPLGAGWTADCLKDTLENSQDSIWLAFDDTNQPKAILIARVVAGEAELLNIVVARGLRRQGLGRALVKVLVDAMRHELVTRIFLEVRISNQAAIRLYESFGFSEVGRRARYYQPDREDALVLACSL